MTRADGRALWLPDVLRAAGLPVEVVPEFRYAGKEPERWLAMVDHHTASNRNSGPRPALGIVRNGRPDVPGPLCNLLLDRRGIHVCIASGAANHPGVSYLPLNGGISSGVKYWALGREIELDGIGEPFPTDGPQHEAMVVGNAAICTYLGIDPGTGLWDHKSICRPVGRKIDVRPYDLAAGRTAVARRMTGTTPQPPTRPEEYFDMDEATFNRLLDERLDAKLEPIEAQLAAVHRETVQSITPAPGRKASMRWLVGRLYVRQENGDRVRDAIAAGVRTLLRADEPGKAAAKLLSRAAEPAQGDEAA